MSRCFPYPPPGYILSRARNEALIESIKLQDEKRRKEEKRQEKKEKRKEKKEKKEEREERKKQKKDKTNLNLDKSDFVKKGHVGQPDKGELPHVVREAKTEVERSSLTEELGRPVSLTGPTSSSDSTQNSNKRQRHSSPLDSSHARGKVILIRLPSKKQNEIVALAKEEQVCLTSGRTDFLAQGNMGLRDRPENVSSTLNVTGSIAGKTGVKSAPHAVLSPMGRLEMEYKNLLENFAPPQCHDISFYSDDLDWLFPSKKRDVRAERRQRCGDDCISPCSRSSALWPYAEFLHGSGVYALPYTIPY